MLRHHKYHYSNWISNDYINLSLLIFYDVSILYLLGIFVSFEKLWGQFSSDKILLVFSLLVKLNRFSVVSLLSFEDSYNPFVTRECLLEEIEFIVSVSWKIISNCIPSFRFSMSCINLPGSIISKSVH